MTTVISADAETVVLHEGSTLSRLSQVCCHKSAVTSLLCTCQAIWSRTSAARLDSWQGRIMSPMH